VIDEEEPSSKFFALHRTAKVGTVIKVRNIMNDLTVYVRVVGTIPETTKNEGIIIKLNERAYDNLKAIDKRFRVQLSYFQ
jgi:rare lipoprotein A (peptidoglycan hydrolase)